MSVVGRRMVESNTNLPQTFNGKEGPRSPSYDDDTLPSRIGSAAQQLWLPLLVSLQGITGIRSHVNLAIGYMRLEGVQGTWSGSIL